MKKEDLPNVDGWILDGTTYKKGGKAALFNEETGNLSVGIYIPAGSKIFEGKVNTPSDVVNILSRY